ncbi:hypothetical protein SD77_0727 [Bacillus badius]|uniref:Uncharacterized protein n=1 Tax=Bacillus badius TaxID=1455 RepID=A0ABR5ATP4_BACBA|nr:hypothetical protein SD78_4027 [Bacillus badius]KIL78126.1 hypothetical protein SD77_0727 [Bacillus badius]
MVGSGEFRSGRQNDREIISRRQNKWEKLPAEHQLIESGEGKINMQQRLPV